MELLRFLFKIHRSQTMMFFFQTLVNKRVLKTCKSSNSLFICVLMFLHI
ncbi:hypothetical protein HanIR_Chr05g0220491 [Helianthus annuus]|nr:hypothetical protein HanIR_Chr05g0220491 [Helianthus annuus]